MTTPTITRAAIRKTICRELGMPFYRYYNAALTADAATSGVDKLVDTDLTQPEHYWEGSWIFSPTTEEVRQVVAFESGVNMLVPDRDFTTSPSTATEYELQTGWNAYEIHQAIDRAIDEAFPNFFTIQEDETLIVQEDKLDYALTQGTNSTNGGDTYLTYVPYRILRIEFEQPHNAQTGTAQAGAATTITASATADLSDVASNPTHYLVSIYDGTGKGQFRRPTSASNTTKVVTISTGTTDWVTTPSTDSKYCIWNIYDQTYDWIQTYAARFDRKDWPTEIHFPNNYHTVYGFRMRITYVAKPAALTTDASTTVVPSEFCVNKALEFLYTKRIQSNRFDRQRYSDLAEAHKLKAEEYRRMYAWQMPQGSPWQEGDLRGSVGYLTEPGDPLAWRRF